MAKLQNPTNPVDNPQEASLDKLYSLARRQGPPLTTKKVPVTTPGKTRAGSAGRDVDIEAELARRERIRNDDAEQDIALKRTTLNRLFWFLTVETALIFILAIMQAVGRPDGFHLDDWSFRIVVSATIAQITGMLFVAVRYLFPNKKG